MCCEQGFVVLCVSFFFCSSFLFSSTGALTQTLNADVEAVQSQTGGKMSALFQNISQIIIGIVIAFV